MAHNQQANFSAPYSQQTRPPRPLIPMEQQGIHHPRPHFTHERPPPPARPPPGQPPSQPPPLLTQNVAPPAQRPRMPMPPQPLMQQVFEPPVSSPAISEAQHQILPQMSELHQPRAFIPQPPSSQPVSLMTQHIMPPGQRPPPPHPPGHGGGQMPSQLPGQGAHRIAQPPQIQVHGGGQMQPHPPGLGANHMPLQPPGHDTNQIQPQPPGLGANQLPHHPLLPHQLPPGPPPLLPVMKGGPSQPPCSMFQGSIPPPPSRFPGQPRPPFPPTSDSFPQQHQGLPPPLFTQAPPPPGQPPIIRLQEGPAPRLPARSENVDSEPEEYDPSEPTSPTREKTGKDRGAFAKYSHSPGADNDSEENENCDEYGDSPNSDQIFDDYGNPIKKNSPALFDDYGNPIKSDTQIAAFDDYGNPIKLKTEHVDEYDPSVPTEADSPGKILHFRLNVVKIQQQKGRPILVNSLSLIARNIH